MVQNLKPYQNYKDSGVPWLGNVPAHWEVTQAKRYYEIQLGKMLQNSPSGSGDDPVSYLKAQHVQWFRVRTDNLPTMWASRTEIGKYGVQVGDLLVCEGGEGGRSALIKDFIGPIIIQNALHRVRPSRSSTNEFLQYVLCTISTTEWFDAINNKATISHFTKDKFGSLNIPFPALPEQHAIARFLDHIDGRINRTIRAKRKLIALLNEQKQAIIHRAVTRGLDPDVPLRPSGVEWLGDIPAHWEERPAKFYFREVDERSTTGEEELLSVSHITGVTPRSQKNITMFKALSYAGHKLCAPGDLVINTMWAWMGALGVAKQVGIVSPSYAVYRPIDQNSYAPEFIDNLLRAKPYISEYICRSTGIRSSRLRLYPEKFLAIPVIRPSINEQLEIVRAVEEETKQFDDAIGRAQRQIDLIREFRTRVIADVVTGKLDVRAAAVSLPQELEEIEPEASEDSDPDAEPDDQWEEETDAP